MSGGAGPGRRSAAILLAGADVGCLEVLLPLYDRLESRHDGRAPLLCLPGDGVARRRLPPGRRLLDEAGALALLEAGGVAACVASTPGKSRDLVRAVLGGALARGVPTALLETIHLSSRYRGLGDLPVDLLATLDGFGLELLTGQGRRTPPAGRVAALGQPAFDALETRLAARAAEARALRRRAGLEEGALVLGFFASAARQVDPRPLLAALAPLLAARPAVELLVFAHPVDAADAAGWQERPGRLAPLLGAADELLRLALCDVVLTQFSTIGAKAAYARRPVVFALGEGAADHLRRNGRLPCFEALAQDGAAAVAFETADLAAALAPLLDAPAARRAMAARQRARFPSLQDSAGRLAEAVAGLC